MFRPRLHNEFVEKAIVFMVVYVGLNFMLLCVCFERLWFIVVIFQAASLLLVLQVSLFSPNPTIMS